MPLRFSLPCPVALLDWDPILPRVEAPTGLRLEFQRSKLTLVISQRPDPSGLFLASNLPMVINRSRTTGFVRYALAASLVVSSVMIPSRWVVVAVITTELHRSCLNLVEPLGFDGNGGC
jgi:hypothetical protein